MPAPDKVKLRPAPSVHTRSFDGELVILDLAKGQYMSLDAVGSLLWTGLEEGLTIEEVARRVVEKYDVSLDVAVRDLEALTRELLEEGLLVEAPS